MPGRGRTTYFSIDRILCSITGQGRPSMHIEHLEQQASVELVARLSLKEDICPENQKRAELLRSRIEELDRRLAKLNSDRKLLQRLRQ